MNLVCPTISCSGAYFIESKLTKFDELQFSFFTKVRKIYNITDQMVTKFLDI